MITEWSIISPQAIKTWIINNSKTLKAICESSLGSSEWKLVSARWLLTRRSSCNLYLWVGQQQEQDKKLQWFLQWDSEDLFEAQYSSCAGGLPTSRFNSNINHGRDYELLTINRQRAEKPTTDLKIIQIDKTPEYAHMNTDMTSFHCMLLLTPELINIDGERAPPVAASHISICQPL